MTGRDRVNHCLGLTVKRDAAQLIVKFPAGGRPPAPTEKRIAPVEEWAAESVRRVWIKAAKAGAVELLLVARGLI
jgi:hypothetical protein